MLSFMLVCAVVASLAVGVFVAQALCVLMFHVFRMRVNQVAATRTAKAQLIELGSVRS
jgi:uncharacterized protein (DUF2062 family)